MRETRFHNNVSSLRPNANSDYFGNAEMDEHSNVKRKNETKVTRVRNTMAPATASTPQLSVISSSTHRALMPSKTPAPLYSGSMGAGLGLGDVLDNHQFHPLGGISGYATSKASENRSKTAFQSQRKDEAPAN